VTPSSASPRQAPHGSIAGNSLSIRSRSRAAADRPVSPAGDRPARRGCATSPALRDSRDRRPPARTSAAEDPSPLCHQSHPVNHRQRCLSPAPVLASSERRGDGEALMPMLRVGRRDRRGRDKVQVFKVHRGTAGPVHRTRQGDGAVNHHRLGVRDPGLSVNPDRHARGGQGLDPAYAFARRGPVRDQPDINAALLGPDQRLDDPRASRQPAPTKISRSALFNGADGKRCAVECQWDLRPAATQPPGTTRWNAGASTLPASRPCAGRRNMWLRTRRVSSAPSAISGPSGGRCLKKDLRRSISGLPQVQRRRVRFRL
jgi:hypothetical protein